MDDSDFVDWSEAVQRACTCAGLALPEPATLGFMYDDGLEPEEVAAPAVQERYCSRPARSFGAGAGDLRAERLHQPD